MNPRVWWRRRSLRSKITVSATLFAMAFLLVLSRLAGGAIGNLLVGAADTELHRALDDAVPAVSSGQPVRSTLVDVQLRVLDTDGAPVDGGPRPKLSDRDVHTLMSGMDVLRLGDDPPHRWIGQVVYDPTGLPRLVAAGADLVGYDQAVREGADWLSIAAVLASLLIGVATWFVVGWSLWPVRRMRAAAGELPAGERLPVPEAHDELRSLAEALNDLLSRRDEAVQRLRRFTGDAAHELRSPVASIRAQAEVAVAHPDPEFAQEVLAAVTDESERMSTLVTDLLALARSDAGESQPVGRVDVSEAAIAAAERLSGNGGPRIRVDAPRAGAVVLCAPGEVALVLNNLLNNAIRYARVQVRVTVLPAGATVRLLVDDDGPGVPIEHRSRLFDRFYRVDDDRARGTGGAGLGLALVAETVRRRGGTVRVTDSPDGGARFEVRWQAAGLAMWGRI
ncbi:ATP-binding protein [Kutzneria buriramensis]|uniref:histidine kinase n=1 Tax=Kutzneria buriramensis TaxID=1045776 RepID=A0A3E0HBX7_9PSEU|nr:ATP-binding protein [Kutzneria buriramensis]REH41933.1 signal transduction histidine kinase [Kutzneria buriramensis]